MRQPLPKPEFALNPVRASILQGELDAEFRKAEWREAYASALARWKAEGHAPQRLAAATPPTRKRSAGWID
jgi:hypothetical protein